MFPRLCFPSPNSAPVITASVKATINQSARDDTGYSGATYNATAMNPDQIAGAKALGASQLPHRSRAPQAAANKTIAGIQGDTNRSSMITVQFSVARCGNRPPL